MLHGFMGDPSDWDLVRSELPEYEIVTPTITPAPDWDAGVGQLAADLPDRSLFVGYSMGARLCLAIALSRPEICAGLVFVSGNPGIEDESARDTRYAGDCKIADRIDAQPRRDFLHSWYTESTVFRSLSPDVRDDEIERKSMASSNDWSDILRTYSIGRQPDFWSRLSELQVPVMAIAGMLDRKYANIILRMGTLPTISARIVPACGHIVHREQPHVFLRLLQEFIESHFSD